MSKSKPVLIRIKKTGEEVKAYPTAFGWFIGSGFVHCSAAVLVKVLEK
jgi:hypothetical protein